MKNSLFIIVFHKGKFTNEKKDRVMVMYIENFTKPLYRVFPTDYFTFFLFHFKTSFLPIAALNLSLIVNLPRSRKHNPQEYGWIIHHNTEMRPPIET